MVEISVKDDQRNIVFSLRVSEKLYERIRQLAFDKRVSKNVLINEVLEKEFLKK